MKKMLGVLVILAMVSTFVVSVNAEQVPTEVPEQKRIIFTTMDLKEDYEIIGVLTLFEDVSKAIARDPFEKAKDKIFKKLAEAVRASDADAVIGIRWEIANMNQAYVGKLLYYGTLVKFREK